MDFIRFTFSLKKGIANIGDFIQELAAMRFYNEYQGEKKLVPVRRDELNSYSGGGKIAKLIMNGWFTNIPQNWPPSKSIDPLFVSYHLNAKAADVILDEPSNVAWFKEHEPIGCRDEYTAETLRQKGIDAYFSGCLTLTLGDKYPTSVKSDKVYIVDPYFKGSRCLGSILKATLVYCRKPNVLRKISQGLYHSTSLKSILLTAQYYSIYTRLFPVSLIENAEYIQHQNHKYAELPSDEARFQCADALLRKYSEAALVITGRIHCALPSIGIGTRVVFTIRHTDNVESTCRYGGLKDLFNVAYISNDGKSYIQTENGDVVNKVNNPQDIPVVTKYKSYKAAMIERCRNFINS